MLNKILVGVSKSGRRYSALRIWAIEGRAVRYGDVCVTPRPIKLRIAIGKHRSSTRKNGNPYFRQELSEKPTRPFVPPFCERARAPYYQLRKFNLWLTSNFNLHTIFNLWMRIIIAVCMIFHLVQYLRVTVVHPSCSQLFLRLPVDIVPGAMSTNHVNGCVRPFLPAFYGWLLLSLLTNDV